MSIITSDTEQPSTEDQPSVSINTHCLTYDSTPVGLAAGQQRDRSTVRRAAAMVGAIVVIMIVVAAAATAVDSVRPVGAAESEVKIVSVHFDLTAPATENTGGLQAAGPAQPASYQSLVVEHRGVELGLDPIPGAVRVHLDQAQAPDMAADLDGLRLGSAAPDFANGLADAVSSRAVHRFVRFTPSADGSPLAIDVSYGRPLQGGDFVLVQERLGDASLELTAINATGVAIGNTVVVGPSYQWNTGHGPTPEEPVWATAVSFDRFVTNGEPISSVRVVGNEAEFKVLALGPAAAPSAASIAAPAAPEPVDLATGDQGVIDTAAAETAPLSEASEPPPFAAVGIESGLQPAIAVGGTGCDSAPDVGRAIANADATVGEAGTYCFTVTNLGTTHLSDVAISDPELGLSQADLAKLSGPEVLAPGQQAVYYHHGVVAEPAGLATIVTALPIDEAGNPIAGFVAPAAAVGENNTAINRENSAEISVGQPAAETGLTEADAPAILANVVDEPAAASGPAEALNAPAITELALTGMLTEPWVLVIFAMAFIFIGYTAFVAFKERESRAAGKSKGHDQLDALGFD